MAVKKAMSAKDGGPTLKTAPSSKGTAKATPSKTTAARVVRAVRATAARATVAARKVAPARATATKSTATKSTATKATAGKPAAAKATARKPAATKATARKPAATKATARKPAARTTSAPSSRGAARKMTKAAGTKVPATAAPLRTHKIAATTTSAAPTPRLRVGKNEKPWTAKELAVVHAALEADVARLRAEISAAESDLAGLMRDAGDGAGDDQADAGTKTFEREQEISLVNNAREVSEQSEHALERILDGSYGICESCGNPIGKNRLLVFPRATLCVPCKSKQERR